jgi:6-phosphogluconolactonase
MRAMDREFVLCDTPDDVTRMSSELIQRICTEAILARGYASLAISGGSTPQTLFKLWQAETFPGLTSVKVFMSDERLVPTSSDDSNQGTMLRLWPAVSLGQVHLPDVSGSEESIASHYQSQVVDVLGEHPSFDCVMLGLGEDGHTASLFPGKPSLTDSNLICMADYGALPPPVKRLTFTYKLINNARNVVVIAAGAKKRSWIESLLTGNNDTSTFPLSGVTPHGKLWIVLDQAAWPEA